MKIKYVYAHRLLRECVRETDCACVWVWVCVWVCALYGSIYCIERKCVCAIKMKEAERLRLGWIGVGGVGGGVGGATLAGW